MKIHSSTLTLIMLCSSLSFAEVAPKCFSGKAGNNNMIDQLNAAQSISPITAAVLKKYPLKSQKATEALTICVDCDKNPLATQTQPIADIAKSAQGIRQAPKLLFKEACLNISNKFDANTEEVSCPDGRRSKSRDLCMNNDVLSYINSVVSSFYACAQAEGLAPVSPEVLFQMYSMETGFRPQYAYNGGLGMGQLTGVFIKDNMQAWRGGASLKKIANSSKPECDAASMVAKKDLSKSPQVSNACSFIALGEGMERNIMHTLIGLNTSWEKDIAPLLKSYLEKHKDHPAIEDIKSLSVINAYGFGGRAAARAAVRRLTQLPPDQYRTKMQEPLYGVRKEKDGKKESVVNYLKYTNGLARRQNQIAAELAEPLRSEFAKNKTRACINEVN